MEKTFVEENFTVKKISIVISAIPKFSGNTSQSINFIFGPALTFQQMVLFCFCQQPRSCLLLDIKDICCFCAVYALELYHVLHKPLTTIYIRKVIRKCTDRVDNIVGVPAFFIFYPVLFNSPAFK